MKPSLVVPAFLLFVSLGCAARAGAEDVPAAIRFGEVGGTNVKTTGGKPTGTGLVTLASYLGYWEKEFGPDGPKIEQVFFAGTGPAQNEALAQGNIDFGSYGGVPNVIGLAGGIPAHIVATRRYLGAGGFVYIGVKADSSVQKVDDLRGKRIAVQKGTNPYQSLLLLLQSHGIEEKDITIVNLQGAEALAAFNAGSVDAVFGGINLLVLRDKGGVRLLEGTKDFKQEASASGTLVNDRFEQTYPGTVARVVKVLTETAAWASREENRTELLAFISDRSWGPQYIREEYEGPLKERFDPLIDEAALNAYRSTVQFAADHKLIRKAVGDEVIRGWFLPEYQRQALKDLGLEGYWAAGPVQ